jgi:hypothetical protein
LCAFYFYRIIGILTPFFADSIRVVNRKMKKIILLEFKRVSDVVETYFQDMWKVSEWFYPSKPGVKSCQVSKR